VEVIARLVQTSPDRVREMIHRFNEVGMDSLDPAWGGGRPRRIAADDEALIVETAKKRPGQVGVPLAHWRLRKLRRWLGENADRSIVISNERLRQILEAHEVDRRRHWHYVVPQADGRPDLACFRPGAFVEQLAQVLGSAADVTFPLGSPAFRPPDGLFAVVEVLDHPLAYQSAGLDPAGFGEPAQLLDAFIGQP